MKRTKQIASILLASMMAMSTISMTALADESKTTISVQAADSDNYDISTHTFYAYQIFTGDVYTDDTASGDTTGLSNVRWGSAMDETAVSKLVEASKETTNYDALGISAAFSDTLTVDEFAKLLSGSTHAQAQAWAKVLEDVVSDEKVVIKGNEDGELPQGGYYLIKDATENTTDALNMTLLMVTSGTSNEIKLKASEPTLIHEILNNDDDTYGAVGDYQIGDTVHFRITVPVWPYAMDNGKDTTVNICAKLGDNLTLLPESLTLGAKADGADAESQIYYTSDYYFVYYDESDYPDADFCIPNTAMEGTTYDDQTMYVFYDAIVTAVDPDAKGEYYNASTAWVDYPTALSNGKNTGSKEMKAYAHTLYANVKKIDKSTKNALSGAAFALTKKSNLDVSALGTIDANGAPTTTTDLIPLTVKNGVYYVTYADSTDTKQYYFPAGNAKIVGLDDNTDYYLIETKAPDNYQALDAPVLFNIGSAHYSDDNISLITTGDNAYSITVDGTAGDDTITVENAEIVKVTLPSTGGMGTTIFYVLGSVLVLGSAVLLIVKKRMKYEN
jgi:LPXTG-motif cell wall-anchored protein